MEPLIHSGDVILIHVEEKPAFYARVEEIQPDVRKGWRRIRFVVLTIPLQEITWILEPSQIDGEPFTMGGTPFRIERLPEPKPWEPVHDDPSTHPKIRAKVISFPPRKES